MRKLLLTIVSVIALVSMLSITAMANDGTVPRYTTTQVYMYASASSGSGVLQSIPAGTKVHAWVEEQQNGFTRCDYSGQDGWIYTSCLSTTQGGYTPSPSPSPTPASGDTGGGSLLSLDGVYNQTRTLAQRCKVYTQPTDISAVSWTMEAGTAVYVTNVTNGWAQITSPYTGYIPSCYIDGWNVPTNYPKHSNTWYLGYNWEAVYQYDYYKANNPDVVAALGTSESALLQHFVEHGMKEGRRGNGSFDLYTYLVNNRYLYDRYGLSDLSHYYKEYCGIPH